MSRKSYGREGVSGVPNQREVYLGNAASRGYVPGGPRLRREEPESSLSGLGLVLANVFLGVRNGKDRESGGDRK